MRMSVEHNDFVTVLPDTGGSEQSTRMEMATSENSLLPIHGHPADLPNRFRHLINVHDRDIVILTNPSEPATAETAGSSRHYRLARCDYATR